MKRKGADYHHGDLRRALVEATIRLVEERGAEGFTLRAAAKLAGVSDGAPYHHFADKEALLAAVAEEGYRLLYDEMLAASERQRGDARKKSTAMGVAYVLFAANHPARFRLMFGQCAHERQRYPALARAGERTYNLVRQGLARAHGDDPNRPAARQAMLNGWALVHGLSMLLIDGYLGDYEKQSRRLERLVWGSVEWLQSPSSPDRDSVPRSRRRSTG